MRGFFERGTLRRAALPFLVACLLIFQGALAGLASAAAGSASGLIAQICVSGDSGSSDDSSKSVSHHAGSCCILQHNVLTQPDVDPRVDCRSRARRRDGDPVAAISDRRRHCPARTSAISASWSSSRNRLIPSRPDFASGRDGRRAPAPGATIRRARGSRAASAPAFSTVSKS